MEQTKNKEEVISFKIKMEEPLLNSIRRYINEIPTLAIDEVEIFKNDSAMYDETLAHRIALVPLKNQKIASGKDVELKLSVKKEGIVYSEELKGIEVVYGKIPLTILDKGQEIELIAKVNLGKGKDHSKYSPGILNYKEVFDVKVDKDIEKEKIMKICPKGVFEIDSGKLKINNEKCDMCEACIDLLQKEGEKINISTTGELIVNVESFGQLKAKELIPSAIKELKKDLAEIAKKI